MREINRVLFIIDADTPDALLNAIIRDGATAEGYDREVFTSTVQVDGYVKLKKA